MAACLRAARASVKPRTTAAARPAGDILPEFAPSVTDLPASPSSPTAGRPHHTLAMAARLDGVCMDG